MVWVRIVELVKDHSYTVFVCEGSWIVKDLLLHGKREEVVKRVEKEYGIKCSEFTEWELWDERRNRWVKVVDAICEPP